MKKQLTTIAMISVAGYIAAQILSDITSLKVAVLGPFSVDAGTFIYPITFTLRDLVHKAWGKHMARRVIVTAGVINLLMALYFKFVIMLPADPTWPFQEQFQAVLSPLWRIVFASIIAEIVSELIDTEAYSFFVKRITKKFQWLRVLFSNSLAIPIDSALFVLIAFWGDLPSSTVWSIFITNVLIKGAVTLASLPLIYTVRVPHEQH